MEKLIINKEYVFSSNGDIEMLLSPNMDKIYVVHDEEIRIIKTFNTSKTIAEAIESIRCQFTAETFNQSECKDFIEMLCREGILINDTN